MQTSFQENSVLVRRFTPSDAPAFCAAARESGDTVGRWLPWCHPDYSLSEAEVWIALCERHWAEDMDYEFGIFDVVSGEVLGGTGINQLNRNHNFGNLGYWVAQAADRVRRRAVRRTAGGGSRSPRSAWLGLKSFCSPLTPRVGAGPRRSGRHSSALRAIAL